MNVAARIRLAALCAAALLPSLPVGVEGQFGRNRVRYEAQDFRLLRTEHIDLYHAPGLEAVALDAGRLAERAYTRLSRVLQHEFRDRIPVLLYGSHHQFQQTNALTGPVDESTGGVTEFFKRRVVLPFTGSWPEFEHVLVHELVHAFQLDVLHGDSPPEALLYGTHPPLWFMEGMAEYLSVGGVDPQTRAWVRDGVLTGYLPDLETLGREGGYLSYRFGQSFWAFVAGRWGDEAVGEILQRVTRLGTDGAFLAVTGRDPQALGEEWARAVRGEVLPGIVATALDGESAPGLKRLAPRNGLGAPWALAPSLSPDGSRMVHLSTRGGESFDLWLADGRTGEGLRRLVRGGRSPGLESLRFMTSSPSFSPDGRTVAFTARSGARDVLVLLDVDTGRRERIELPLRTAESPAWSPDGQHIVMSGTRSGPSDLWVLARDGTGLRPLTQDRFAALHPAWSPDGGSIAFVTDRGPGADEDQLRFGAYRVALLDPLTGVVRVLPGQVGQRNVSPAWSPDGSFLVWVGDGAGTPGLQIHELGTSDVQRLGGVSVPVLGITPLSPVVSWSRSGAMVVVGFEQAGYALHRIDDPLVLPRHPVTDLPRVAVEAAVGADSGPAPGGGGGFRQQSIRRALEQRRSVGTLRALLDSTAAVLPDTSDFERGPVRTRLSPDLVMQPTLGAQVGGGYGSGVYGGTAVALSDILGNHRVVGGVSLNGSLRDAAGGVNWVWSRNRWDLLLGVDQTPFYRWVRSGVIPGDTRNGWEDTYLRELSRRATAGVRYPLSTFRRVEVIVSAGHDGRDVLRVGFEPSGRTFRRTTEGDGVGYLEGSVAWVHDDTRWGWNGAVGGSRARVAYLRSGGGLDYDQLRMDLRKYVGRPGGPVLAGRVFTLLRQGEEADLRSFFWGGPLGVRGWSGGSFGGGGGDECTRSADAVDGGALTSCPVRDQLIGSSGGLASAELRLPLIREVQIGSMGNLPPVEAVVFGDAGMTWSRRVCSDGSLGLGGAFCGDGPRPELRTRRTPGDDPFLVRSPVGAWGVGLRLNLLVVQMEIHHARPLGRPGRGGVWGFVLGPPF